MSSTGKAIKPLSDEGLRLVRAHEQEARGQDWSTYYRKWLAPGGALGAEGIEASIMSKLRAISPEFPGGKYTGNTPEFERRLHRALNIVRENKRRALPTQLMAGAFVDLPRFRQLYAGIERNARFTDKRRGAAYIGDTGAGKTALCEHVARKYRTAKGDDGELLFDEVLPLLCTSAWRSEQAFYTMLAAKLEIAGGPWRGLYAVQSAVGNELLTRGKVLLVIDEFQVQHNAVFLAFKWLENETPARWFIAGNQSLYERMRRSSLLFPNAEQFEARTLPIQRLDHLTPADVTPFIRAYVAAGATLDEPEEQVVARVVSHARDFGRFNLVADTLPKMIAAHHGNRWSERTIDLAVRDITTLHGRE